MKTNAIIVTTALCGVTLWISGCGNNQPAPPPPAANQTPPSFNATKGKAGAEKAAQDALAQAAADAAAAKASQEAAAAKAAQELAAAKAAQEAAAAKAAADAASKVAATSQQAQGLIDQAKKLITDKKYPDALALLQQLLTMALSNDQKTETEALVTQTKKAMAGEAIKTGGGFLK